MFRVASSHLFLKRKGKVFPFLTWRVWLKQPKAFKIFISIHLLTCKYIKTSAHSKNSKSFFQTPERPTTLYFPPKIFFQLLFDNFCLTPQVIFHFHGIIHSELPLVDHGPSASQNGSWLKTLCNAILVYIVALKLFINFFPFLTYGPFCLQRPS